MAGGSDGDYEEADWWVRGGQGGPRIRGVSLATDEHGFSRMKREGGLSFFWLTRSREDAKGKGATDVLSHG